MKGTNSKVLASQLTIESVPHLHLDFYYFISHARSKIFVPICGENNILHRREQFPCCWFSTSCFFVPDQCSTNWCNIINTRLKKAWSWRCPTISYKAPVHLFYGCVCEIINWNFQKISAVYNHQLQTLFPAQGIEDEQFCSLGLFTSPISRK